MKKIIQLLLKISAKIILAKYKPDVIGITGSVGKTSAKEAVYTVLSKKYNVRQNIKNYNNEIGLPLTIIGAMSPGRSFIKWIGVLLRVIKLSIFTDKKYPKILILEMGVDHPNDMDYLSSIVKCNVGIVTNISHVHLEYFGVIENIQKEKDKLIKSLPKDGWAILNYDNEKTRQIKSTSKAKVLTYGFDEKADIHAQDIIFSFTEGSDISSLRGVSFKLRYQGSFTPVLIPKVVGQNSIYAALAGAAVGSIYNMNMVEISNALKDLNSPKGRMNLIEGIKNTMIIDDSYNSSPQAVMSAIGVLKEIPIKETAKRFAVLGDMLELGDFSEEGHKEAGKYLAKLGVDYLITIGEKARDFARGAEEYGMSEDHIFKFTDTELAGKFIQDKIKKGDLILVKGSQKMRMENITKEIMADPLHAKDLLVRQDKEWFN